MICGVSVDILTVTVPFFKILIHHLSKLVLSLISKEGPSQCVQAFCINRQHLGNTLLLEKTTEIKGKLPGEPFLNDPQLLQREKEDSMLVTEICSATVSLMGQ